MSHKADKSFFNEKRDWSKRKDRILASYLRPYLAKINRRGKPVLIVDGFSGPGKFKDGTVGSPIIICKAAHELNSRSDQNVITVFCVERNPDLYRMLESSVSEYSFAKPTMATSTQSSP